MISCCTERAFLVEAALADAEDVGFAARAEAVLGNFPDAFAVGFAAFVFVDVEFAAYVDGMEDCIFASEFACLRDLADEDDDAVVGLGPVGECFHAADSCHGISTVGPFAVVEGLERVLEDEDLFVRVSFAEGVSVFDEVSYQHVLADDEAVGEAEAFGYHFDLVEGFFAGVVEADVACLRDRVSELEEHRRFACTGRAREHHDRGRNEAFAAEGIVEEFDAGFLAIAERFRDLDITKDGAAFKVLDTDGEIHFAHVVIVLLFTDELRLRWVEDQVL